MNAGASVRINNATDLHDESEFDRLCMDLLEQIGRRNEQALRQLYDLTVSKVYHLANRITGNTAYAEETVPEVYLQVWRDASRYDLRRGRVLTWLLVICRSRALDCLRRCDRATSIEDVDCLADQEATDASHPESMLLLQERNVAVRQAILKLSPARRQVVALAFLRGLSHQEIADCTGMPLGTVKAHLRRATEELKRELAAHKDHL